MPAMQRRPTNLRTRLETGVTTVARRPLSKRRATTSSHWMSARCQHGCTRRHLPSVRPSGSASSKKRTSKSGRFVKRSRGFAAAADVGGFSNSRRPLRLPCLLITPSLEHDVELDNLTMDRLEGAAPQNSPKFRRQSPATSWSPRLHNSEANAQGGRKPAALYSKTCTPMPDRIYY